MNEISTSDAPQAREADCVAANVLVAIRRGWDEAHEPIPVFLLEAWYALNARVTEPVAGPVLAPTWVELSWSMRVGTLWALATAGRV